MDELFEFPCAFPIKIMGKNDPALRETVAEIVRRFDPEFKDASIEERHSSTGRYIGLTCTLTATSRAQLDALYEALSHHPLVSVVL